MIFSASMAYGHYIEAKGSYFMPSEQIFKDIHGNGMSFGGEIGLNLVNGLSLWIGGDYYTNTGKLTFSGEETELQIIPLYGGLKYRMPNPVISPYVGLGVGYFLYKETNIIGTVEKGNIGYIGQLGVIFKVGGPLFFDIQGCYSYCKVKPADVEVDLGGLKGTIGLGFEF